MTTDDVVGSDLFFADAGNMTQCSRRTNRSLNPSLKEFRFLDQELDKGVRDKRIEAGCTAPSRSKKIALGTVDNFRLK